MKRDIRFDICGGRVLPRDGWIDFGLLSTSRLHGRTRQSSYGDKCATHADFLSYPAWGHAGRQICEEPGTERTADGSTRRTDFDALCARPVGWRPFDRRDASSTR